MRSPDETNRPKGKVCIIIIKQALSLDVWVITRKTSDYACTDRDPVQDLAIFREKINFISLNRCYMDNLSLFKMLEGCRAD